MYFCCYKYKVFPKLLTIHFLGLLAGQLHACSVSYKTTPNWSMFTYKVGHTMCTDWSLKIKIQVPTCEYKHSKNKNSSHLFYITLCYLQPEGLFFVERKFHYLTYLNLAKLEFVFIWVIVTKQNNTTITYCRLNDIIYK